VTGGRAEAPGVAVVRGLENVWAPVSARRRWWSASGRGSAPGTTATKVIETMRGHELGRVISSGPALPNTGVPGLIAGRAAERVLHAPASGVARVVRGIGEVVAADEVVCVIDGFEAPPDAEGPQPGESVPVAGSKRQVAVPAAIAGVLRGMIPTGRGCIRAGRSPTSTRGPSWRRRWTRLRQVACRRGGAPDAVLQGLRASGLWSPPR